MNLRWITCLATLLCACSTEAPRHSVLLVTLDTTRADAIGVYGGPPGITPNIDRLAREGITFATARAVVPLTLPSHASMLTGLYPPRHGVRTNGLMPLPSSAATLAEGALEADYQTAAFVAAPVLDRRFGLDQGFETWGQPRLRERSEQVLDHYGALTAEKITERALRWIRERDRGRPFLLWVHYFDPHMPYGPPGEFVEQAGGEDLYLAEVARVDAAIGQLVEELEAQKLLDQTLIAVVGDHGESRGEHGERTHGHFVYEGALRVPFVLRPPAGAAYEPRRGTAEMAPTSVVDVFDTLAGAMGLAEALSAGRAGGPDGATDGLDLLAGPVPEDRGVYFECYYGYLHLGWSPLTGWADAEAKYIHSPVPELYVPSVWPDERVNRIHERGEAELTPYRDQLAALEALPSLEPDDLGTLTDLSDGLASLGYVEATATGGQGPGGSELPGLLDATELPSPHSRAGELDRCDRVRSLVLAANPERAIVVLQEILAQNPRNAYALETLGEQLLQTMRPEEAVPVYRKLLEVSGPRGSIHAGFGRALERTGELEEAVEHYRRAVELVPIDTETMRLLASGLDRLGLGKEADHWRSEVRSALGY